jgi:hypothetical protein
MYNRKEYVEKLKTAFTGLSCPAQIGDILITAVRKESYDSKAFGDKITKLHSTLKLLYPKGVYVVTRADEGKMHAHVAVEMPEMSLSFDWIAFDQSEFYYKLYCKTKKRADLDFHRQYKAKYEDSLPESWRTSNEQLMAIGEELGLGRIFMTPVRKTQDAYMYYLIGNIPLSRQARDKYIRFFYSWKLPTQGKCMTIDQYTNSYRRRLKKIVEGLQLSDETFRMTLRAMLGDRWYYRIKELIQFADNLPPELETKYKELKSAVALHVLRS